MGEIRLAFHNIGKFHVAVADDIIWITKRVFEPLAIEAGQTLRIIRGPHLGDLNITFDFKTPYKMCQFNSLGDGGDRVFALVHQDWRVCGPERADGTRDLRTFMSGDRRLGRALANTAIHELGHFIAFFDESHDQTNYMTSGGIPKNERTRSNQRELFAGHKSFNPDQKRQIVAQFRTKTWLGALNTQ